MSSPLTFATVIPRTLRRPDQPVHPQKNKYLFSVLSGGATPLDPPIPAAVPAAGPATRPSLRPGTRWAGQIDSTWPASAAPVPRWLWLLAVVPVLWETGIFMFEN